MTDNGSVSGPIKAAGILSTMDVWWVGDDFSVQGAYWSEGQPWQRYELAPPYSASVNADIAAVSRIPNSMEVWWEGPISSSYLNGDGSIHGAYWYEGQPWQRYQLAPPNSACQSSKLAAVSRMWRSRCAMPALQREHRRAAAPSKRVQARWRVR